MTAPVDAPRTFGELARMIGWSTRRMRRKLMGIHEKTPFLVRAGGGWTTTVTALRVHWDGFGEHLASARDVDDIAEDLGRQGRELRAVERSLWDFRKKSAEWMKRVESRLKALEDQNETKSQEEPKATIRDP